MLLMAKCQIAVHDIHRQSVGLCEQRQDTILSERIDDQSLLISIFLGDDMLEQFFCRLRLSFDKIMQFSILEEYHE